MEKTMSLSKSRLAVASAALAFAPLAACSGEAEEPTGPSPLELTQECLDAEDGNTITVQALEPSEFRITLPKAIEVENNGKTITVESGILSIKSLGDDEVSLILLGGQENDEGTLKRLGGLNGVSIPLETDENGNIGGINVNELIAAVETACEPEEAIDAPAPAATNG